MRLFEQAGLSLEEANVVAVGHRVVQGGRASPPRSSSTPGCGTRSRTSARSRRCTTPRRRRDRRGPQAVPWAIPHVAVRSGHRLLQFPAGGGAHLCAEQAGRRRVPDPPLRRPRHQPPLRLRAGRRTLRRAGEGHSALRQIVLHLGNGARLGGARRRPGGDLHGAHPARGPVMGTRTGDIDPAVYAHLSRSAGRASMRSTPC